MIETTTIAHDLVTPKISQILIAEAQALLNAHAAAEEVWKARVKEIQDDPNVPSAIKNRAQEVAQEEAPQEYENYVLVAYCRKTIDRLKMSVDPAAPKITIPHDFVTDEVMILLGAQLDAKEAAVKPTRGQQLHLHHVQSRERLNKMAPTLAQYKQTKQAARKAHKDAVAAATQPKKGK